MLETIMQKTWKMMPTWSQNGDQNPSKKHEKTIQKNITKNDAKIKRQKAMGPEGPRARSRGPWARSAGRGKEFLRRLQVKVPSCIQHPAKKQTPGEQLKSKALEPLAVNSHALDVPAGTVRIY